MLENYKEELWKNLQTAIELEHSTIPPYLTAMFTINEDTNAFAYTAIRSVVMEEMLHMTLLHNLGSFTAKIKLHQEVNAEVNIEVTS